jgi:hypothetical protein
MEQQVSHTHWAPIGLGSYTATRLTPYTHTFYSALFTQEATPAVPDVPAAAPQAAVSIASKPTPETQVYNNTGRVTVVAFMQTIFIIFFVFSGFILY